MDETHDCRALLAEVGWVRGLARHLARDAHAADDLAQETFRAALVRPPPLDRPLKSWLAGVVRNLARRERRDSFARLARERDAARDEAQSPSAELDERFDAHRAVVDAVGRLDAPYRAAILMRYFEELSPRAIAARTGEPLRTVHTRLNRALHKLRAELDRAHGGDRRSWLCALIPIARGKGVASTAAIGAFVMDAKLKVGLALVALAGVCSTIALWPRERADIAPSPTVASSVETPMERDRTSAPLDDRGANGARESAARTPEPAPTAATPDASAPSKLAGRVIDVERAPVAGVNVRCFSGATDARAAREALTDSNGRFEIADPPHAGHVDVASPGWTSLFRPELGGAPSAREVVIVVARSVKLGGVVVDAQHRPIASANVSVPLPFGMRSRFDAILDASSSVEHATRSDDAGRFELGAVPLFDGARLVTAQGGFVTDSRALPAYDELSLEIVLAGARDDRETLLGTVVDAADDPVEGAWVAVGTNAAKSGPNGTFALDLTQERGRLAQPDPKQSTRITAVKAGHLPGELTRAAGDAWPEPLVLRLGPAPLVIDGRVVDALGKPVAKAQVWTSDETHFGYIELDGGESTMRFGSTVEGILRGDPFEHRVHTNALGRFELGGLVARDYRVHVLDPKSMCATTVTLAAGARSVEIRIPKEDVHARVAGRVTSLSGEPIAGLLVHLRRRTIAGFELERVDGGFVTTDADGRFAFVNVSRALSSMHVLGEAIGLGGFERAIAPDDDVEHLEVRVPMRVHVQIEASGRTDLDWAAIVDENGNKLELGILHGTHAYATRDMKLEAGRSEAFSVSETAKELVLYSKGVEVQRVKLALEHGALNTIRP